MATAAKKKTITLKVHPEFGDRVRAIATAHEMTQAEVCDKFATGIPQEYERVIRERYQELKRKRGG